MKSTDEMLKQAQMLIKQGLKDQARPLLEQIVREDDHNEDAWLWLSAVKSTLEEQVECLENVLMLNPANQKAQRGLENLRQKMASSQPRPASKPNIAPQQPPLAFPAPDMYQANYADPYSPYNAPAGYNAPPTPDMFGSPYDDTQLQDNVGAPSGSSMDWARGSAPAYGSGKQVQEPTPGEYDAWMNELPLDGKRKSDSLPRQRGTPATPQADFAASDDQYSLPATPYEASNDPFDFGNFGSSAPPARPAPNTFDANANQGYSNQGYGASASNNVDFDFSSGPFSSGSGGAGNAPSFGVPTSPTPSSSRSRSRPQPPPTSDDTWQGTVSGSVPSLSDDFDVPGGYNNESAGAGAFSLPTSQGERSSSGRFSFKDKNRALTGTQGKRSAEMEGLSRIGGFQDAEEDPSAFDDNLDLSGEANMAASGVFGASNRMSGGAEAAVRAQAASPAKGSASAKGSTPYVPSVGPFRAIPEQVRAKPTSAGRSLLVILLLILLNVVSLLVLLYVNLRGVGAF